MPKRWLVPQSVPAQVDRLCRETGISKLTASVLIGRGIATAASARSFLTPSLDALHDPYGLAGMREAVDRIRLAIANREAILIYGDYDVDGTVSIVLLKKAIEIAGGSASFHVPDRLKDGYGMRADVVERAAESGVRLIVSVDTGIRANDVVRVASALGMEVIVTDHHLPETELPPALAVINPNRPDCSYPEKNLCGAGVAFKLAHALLASLPWPEGKLDRMLESFLKLVAIATVADVVPLTGENRVIVKHGLGGLTRVHNHGLRAMLEVSRLWGRGAPTAREVAFQIAPRINAAGRMAHARDVIEMFLTADERRARAIAAELHALNQDRQATEAEIVKLVLAGCEAHPVTDEHAGLVFSGQDWHRGVVGIVASRIVERYCRPVFVLSEEEGIAKGSGRSVPAFHLLDALEEMRDLFTSFGGHRQAAGVTLPADRIPEFRRRFNQHAANKLTPADFVPQLAIDALVGCTELTDTTVEEILSLAPFGCGNPPPVFAMSGAELCGEIAVIKEKHVRMRLRQGGRYLFATGFDCASRRDELVPGRLLDVAFCVEGNDYAGNGDGPQWRALLKDFRPSSAAAAS